MSSKTYRKRITLVAIASLGFGLISVVPASAAQVETTTVTAGTGTATAGAGSGRTGVAATFVATATITAADDAATVTFTTAVTGSHAGSSKTDAQWNDSANLSQTGTDNGDYTWGATHATSGAKVATGGAAGAGLNAGNPYVTFGFTPDVAGTYIFTITTTASTGTPVNATVTYTYTAYDAGTATSISVANTSTVGGTALAASKYTSSPVLDPLQVSSITVAAGSTLVLHLTAVGGTITPADETKVSMRGYGGVVATALNSVTADGAEDPLPSFVVTSVPGTYTLDVTLGKNGSYATATDLTTSITMVVTGLSDLSTGLSTAYHAQGAAAGTAALDLVPIAVSKDAGTNAGNITVTLKRADGTAYGDTSSTVYAQVSGPGLLDITADETDVNGDTATDLRIDSLAVPSDGIFNVNFTADGTAGVGTVTVTVVTAAGVSYTVGTESATFFGSASKLAGTQEIKYIRTATSSGNTSGYTGTTPGAYDLAAILVKATDSAGNPIAGLTGLSCVSDNTAVVSTCTITEDDGATTYTRGKGSYFAQVTTAPAATSGQTANVYVRMLDPLDGTKYLVTDSFKFTVASRTVYTTTLTLDKSAYEPGEKATLTVTMKDSAGTPVADTFSTTTTRSCVGADVVANKAITGSLPVAADGCWAEAGVETYKFYVPSVAGEFTLNTVSGYDGVTPIVIKATVSNAGTASESTATAAADAAAEATDAANAATDAANAAAEAADAATAAAQDAADAVAALSAQFNTLVSNIKAQISSLTALIVKIQKKVKA